MRDRSAGWREEWIGKHTMLHRHNEHYSMCVGTWGREHLHISHYHVRGRPGRACAAHLSAFSVIYSVDDGFTNKGVKMSDWTFRVGPFNVRFRRNQRIKP